MLTVSPPAHMATRVPFSFFFHTHLSYPFILTKGSSGAATGAARYRSGDRSSRTQEGGGRARVQWPGNVTGRDGHDT